MQAVDEAEQTHEQMETMQPLDPGQIKVLRIRAALGSAAMLAVALGLDLGPLRQTPVPAYVLPGALLAIALYLVLRFPGRRYRAWGYAEGEDELAIRRGVWVRRRTIVPFGRVQHIDLAQGPIERRFDLAILILHTAGTRSASVSLPGLRQEQAEGMRDRIRAKIRQDLV